MKDRIIAWVRSNKLVTSIAVVTLILLLILGTMRIFTLRSVIDISSINPLITTGQNKLIASGDSREMVQVTDDGTPVSSSNGGGTKLDKTKTGDADNKTNSNSGSSGKSGSLGSGGTGGSGSTGGGTDTQSAIPTLDLSVDDSYYGRRSNCKVSYKLLSTVNSNGYVGEFSVTSTITYKGYAGDDVKPEDPTRSDGGRFNKGDTVKEVDQRFNSLPMTDYLAYMGIFDYKYSATVVLGYKLNNKSKTTTIGPRVLPRSGC